MPIYEYYCPDNNTVYRFFARRPGLSGVVPRCPANPAFRMEKQVSSFAITGVKSKSKREDADGGLDDLDDPRVERAMMEMEKEMASMDENNPDPRQLARLMRRMTELTGEHGGERMEEMIRRLEAGEDPEKLEAEYDDVMGGDADGEDGDGFSGPGDAGDAPEAPGTKMLSRLRRRGAFRPRRRVDPELYEMEDYLPG